MRLDVLFVLNGTAIIFIALLGGLFLYRQLLRQGDPHDWHLLHAGGAGRGVMLLALGAAIHLPVLPDWLLGVASAAIIFFAWASTIAMIITALTGEHGFGQSGTVINRIAHALYVAGALAVFPGFAVLLYGLAAAL